MDIESLKFLYNEDIIYHYTKANTAIDFILYNQHLKFSHRRESNDPIESRTADRVTMYTGPKARKPTSEKTDSDSEDLHESIIGLESKFYQVCFCKNQMGGVIANDKYHGDFEGNEEFFGFAKPRMWEQYADNYTGVCIAFSKNKILELNKNLDLLKGNIKYLTYSKLSYKKLGDISGKYLLRVGKEKAIKHNASLIKRSFFYKHKDYKGENEYRIGVLYDENKCICEVIRGEWNFNKLRPLNVEGCIEAIFMSSYANNKQKMDLREYANKLHIPIFELDWQYNSFRLRDSKFMETIDNVAKKWYQNK